MTPQEVQGAFSLTQLGKDILGHVWNIVDENDQGAFSQKLFAMAIHILYKIKIG